MDLYLNQDLGSLRVIVSDSFLKRAAEEGMRRTTVLSLPGGWSLEFTGTPPVTRMADASKISASYPT
jgi:hypothetical protein